MNETSAVYKSADRYVAAAIDLLRPEISGQPATMEWFPKWIRTNQGHFVQRPHQVSIIPMILLRRSEQLHSLKEYSDLVKALRQVPEIAVQLDALVGTEFTGYMRVDEVHIIRTLLGRVIARLPNLQLDPSVV